MKRFISRGRENQPIQREADAEVSEELAFHLERRVDEYVAGGMTPIEARQAALKHFGDIRQLEQECASLLEDERHQENRRDSLSETKQDVRFALRAALQAPLASFVTIVILALGIGANTAIFAGVKGLLLDALPYVQPDRLVRIYARLVDGTMERGALSPAAVIDVTERQKQFESLGWFTNGTQDVAYATWEAEPQVMTAAFIGGSFFETLGVRPSLGRLLDANDASDRPYTAVVSFKTWVRLLGADPSAVGRVIRLNNDSYTIVGILARDFVGPFGAVDVWLPLDIKPTLNNPISARQSHWLSVIARLKSSASLERGRDDIRTISEALAREYPESQAASRMVLQPLGDDMIGETKTPMIVLMASAGVVLLVACANLAGVLLSRAVSRRREFTIRVALGAARGRLVRQLLTESLLIAFVGGLAGVAVAAFTIRLVERVSSSVLPSYVTLSLDAGPLLFATVMTVFSGVVVGIVPALAATRDLSLGVLREEGRSAGDTRSSGRTRGLLVAGQIALCISLVSGAGLLLRSLWIMTTAPLGFNADGALTMGVRLMSREYTPMPQRVQLFNELNARLERIPGVQSVASASELPSPSMNRDGLTIEGVVPNAGETIPFINTANVSDTYFRTMGIPILRGRVFGAEDGEGQVASVVISEQMARRYWPKGDAIGKRIKLGPAELAPWAAIVGVVGDIRNDPAQQSPAPMAYTPMRRGTGRFRDFVIRAVPGIAPTTLVRQATRELNALDGSLPAYNVSTLSDRVAALTAGRRVPVVLLTSFGMVALLLASVGIYAMFASLAAARERECSVRIALGASAGSVVRLVLREGAAWVLVGVAGGSVGVVVVGRLLKELLFGVPMFDPLTMVSTTIVLVLCSAAALLLPIRRVTRLDPVSVLR